MTGTCLETPILFYDGECGFCDTTVQFLLRRTTAEALVFCPLQSDFARRLFQARGMSSPDLSKAYLLRNGQIHVASAAILHALRLTAGWSRHLGLLTWVPRPVRDWSYFQIARHRQRLLPQQETCRLLMPHERARFLD